MSQAQLLFGKSISKKRSAAFLVLFSFAVVSLASPKPRLEFRAKVVAKGETITLGDILSIEGLPPDVTRELTRLSLGTAPGFGERRTFSDRGLSSLLRYHVGLKEKEVGRELLEGATVVIPKEVIVEGAGLLVTEEQVRARILERARELCSTCKIEIAQVKLGHLKLYPPSSSWDVGLNGSALQGSFTGEIEVVDQYKLIDRVPLSGQFRISRKVAVLKRSLQTNDVIVSGDIEWVERDFNGSLITPAQASELEKARARRPLASGHMIQSADLVREYPVRRGDAVEVLIRQEDWKVSVKGIAEQSGQVGEKIFVKNTASQKKLSAVVVEPGVVEVK